MVGVFRRSFSFPNKNPNRPTQKPPISHHIRSISLPSRSHPLISQIKDELSHLTTSPSTSNSHPLTSTNLSHSLTLLKDTHETLQHILHLPQTLESLRSHPLWVEKLLEDFLRFVDAYGMFQTSLLALKEEHSSAQMAVRKRDESKVVAYIKAKKKIAKEMEKLASGLRCVAVTQHQQYCTLQVPASVADAEVRHVIADVMNVTVSVSSALFNGVATSFASRRLSWAQMVKLSRRGGRVNKEHEGIEELRCSTMESLRNLKKKGDEEVRSVLKTMRDLEECICGIETVSEKVFRALINSRVALLNTLTLTQ
ncbi:hypothetical protein VNO77_11492 [Canavalia gladiata]|uniref:DUF241 domain protein n=1 Tax=Canavalia gladiata TaxID=3824 RepID=A0AAN9MC13_CANGL